MERARRRQSNVAQLVQPRRHRPDYWLLILSAILLAIGLIVVYAISPALSAQGQVSQNYYVNKQLIAIALGVVAFVVMAGVPVAVWRRLQKPLIITGVLATIAALVTPVSLQYPAHRWIRFGGFSLQSVELVKVALLVWLASLLAEKVRQQTLHETSGLLRVLVAMLLIIGLVVAMLQRDLGSSGVIVAMTGAMCFVAGLPLKKVVTIGAIVGILGVLAISAIPYRRERLLTFLHPTANCLGSGYQACQALISVGSGGMIGLGLGRSVQAYGYQPEAANDSIFAIYAEKFGFVGVVALLGLFVAFFGRLKTIVERAPDPYSQLLVTGILAWLSTQAFINIGGMIGLLPLKGITLPFVSYGGTSVVFVMAAVGMVFQISHYTLYSVPSAEAVEGKRHDNHLKRRRLRGTYNPVAGSRG